MREGGEKSEWAVHRGKKEGQKQPKKPHSPRCDARIRLTFGTRQGGGGERGLKAGGLNDEGFRYERAASVDDVLPYDKAEHRRGRREDTCFPRDRVRGVGTGQCLPLIGDRPPRSLNKRGSRRRRTRKETKNEGAAALGKNWPEGSSGEMLTITVTNQKIQLSNRKGKKPSSRKTFR